MALVSVWHPARVKALYTYILVCLYKVKGIQLYGNTAVGCMMALIRSHTKGIFHLLKELFEECFNNNNNKDI